MSALTACGDSDSSKSSSGLEKTNIKVGVLPIADAASIYIARSKGYFKAEGLNVTPTILANGSVTISKVMSGGVDMSYSAYIPIVQAASTGIKVKVIADGYQGRSNLYPIITVPNSSIHSAKQLAGKKIGLINAKGFPSLLTNAALKNAGVNPKDAHLVEIQYPQMPAALENHSIDAAFMTEPYLSQSQQKFGARVIVDTMSGPTADLPVGGYMTSQKFAKENPKTVAAFQRAIAKAQAAATDRNLVGQILPTYIKGLSPQVAQTITLGVYPQTLSKTRLQRVADLMNELGVLKQHYDVQGIL
ncbi:ABC transporter substrate-binding protein [Actinomadura sp. DC4]|uniref:ABC transporter substrate-binding protein n=1 Tax=Actinomadura sp. DC4 TaxID=3055069 RepID=UPI0025B1471F|nr:ABC transporter substrate-binding protein [Actinomadura sp. DC4]MDN3360118.1 ABC transporter substrate-binding protein [Actinomadura sp. DC4]